MDASKRGWASRIRGRHPAVVHAVIDAFTRRGHALLDAGALDAADSGRHPGGGSGTPGGRRDGPATGGRPFGSGGAAGARYRERGPAAAYRPSYGGGTAAHGESAREDPAGGIVRDETPAERLDRNWNELLQELRVIQTGIQVLFGFLLMVPFQARFKELSDTERNLFLGLLALVAVATVTNLAPVIAHRVLFRRHDKGHLMLAANWVAVATLICLGLAHVLGVALVVSVAVDAVPARWAAGGLLALLLLGWVGLPTLVHRQGRAD